MNTNNNNIVDEILLIIENELNTEKQSAKDYEGGMKRYIEELQDSDDFYNEASALSAIDTLESIKEKIINHTKQK